jgi:hypothetical protein
VFTTFAAQIVVPLQLNTNSSALIVPPKPSGATNSATAPQDIRDIREPVPLGPDLTLLWIALTILALAALAWWLLTHKKKSVASPTLFIPPHRKAKERLRGATELLSDPYAFCSLVSDVIRVYLEERFNLHAPDRTTEEFLAELREGTQLNEEHKALLENFLTRCDLVKFAREEPTEGELRGLLDAALRLIDETREIVGINDASPPSSLSSGRGTQGEAPKPPPLPPQHTNQEVAK